MKITTNSDGIILPSGSVASETGLILGDHEATNQACVDSVIQSIKQIKKKESSSYWLLGDAINAMPSEQERANAMQIATNELGFSGVQVVKNICSGCKTIARSNRRSELSFWMHMPVASLEAEHQESMLNAAIIHKWSKAQLEEQVRLLKVVANEAGASDETKNTQEDKEIAEPLITYDQFVKFFVSLSAEDKQRALTKLDEIMHGGDSNTTALDNLVSAYKYEGKI